MRRDKRKLHSPTNRPAASQPRPWNIVNNAGAVPTIELFGDIGASKEGDPWYGMESGAGTFQEFAAELKKIGNVPELRVEIHSYGGSVVVGKGIHDKLLEHPANKTAVIYGICASAATYAALACQKVQIPANSFFLIHNSSGVVFGNANDMRQAADMLDVADDSIAALYAARTGKSIGEIQDIMDADTWMSGTDAVALGLADEVIEPITIDPATRTAPDNFRPALLNSMPLEARAWLDMSTLSNATRAPLPIAPMQTAAPAPTNAAPSTTASAVSAAPVIETSAAPVAPAAPVNAEPDLATQITNAVAAAVAPLQVEITRLGSLANHGVTPQNLGGAQPVANAVTAPAQRIINRTEFSAMNALQRAEFLRSGGKLTD